MCKKNKIKVEEILILKGQNWLGEQKIKFSIALIF